MRKTVANMTGDYTNNTIENLNQIKFMLIKAQTIFFAMTNTFIFVALL